MRIRQAKMDDISDIAHVHVASWKSTYKGIISDEYLSTLSVESRINNWTWVFKNLNPDDVICVAENDEGKIVGFSSGGKCRSGQYAYDSEIYAMYLLEEYQRKGYGKALFSASIDHLTLHQYKSLMVWALEKNKATRFYDRLGGKAFTKKEIQIGSDDLTEVAFGWSEMKNILFR